MLVKPDECKINEYYSIENAPIISCDELCKIGPLKHFSLLGCIESSQKNVISLIPHLMEQEQPMF